MQIIFTLVAIFANGAFGDPRHEDDISNLQLLVPMRYLNTDSPPPRASRLQLPLDGPFSAIPSDAFRLDDAFLPASDGQKTVKKDLSHPNPTSSKSPTFQGGYLYQRCLEYLVNQEVGREIVNDSLLSELCSHYLSSKDNQKTGLKLVFGDLPVHGLDNSKVPTSPSEYGDNEAADGPGPASQRPRAVSQGKVLSNNDLTTYILNALDLGIGNLASDGQGGMSGNVGLKGEGTGVGNAAVGGKGGQVGNLGIGGTGGLFGNLGIGGQGGFFGNVGVGSGHQHLDLYSGYSGNPLSSHYPARTSNLDHRGKHNRREPSKSKSNMDDDERSREFQKRSEGLFMLAGQENGEGTVASKYSLGFVLGRGDMGTNVMELPVGVSAEKDAGHGLEPMVGSLAVGGSGGEVGNLVIGALCSDCHGGYGHRPVRGRDGERGRPSNPSKSPLQEQRDPEFLSKFRPVGGRGRPVSDVGYVSNGGFVSDIGYVSDVDYVSDVGHLPLSALLLEQVVRGNGERPLPQSQLPPSNSPPQEQPEAELQPRKSRPAGEAGALCSGCALSGFKFHHLLRGRPELRRHFAAQPKPPSKKPNQREESESDLLSKFRPMGGRRGWMVMGNADARLKQYINSNRKPWLII